MSILRKLATNTVLHSRQYEFPRERSHEYLSLHCVSETIKFLAQQYMQQFQVRRSMLCSVEMRV